MFGMIWVGIQRFGTMIISFLSNIVLARLLTPDDFGCIGMLLIFIAISNTFVDGGFGSALIQKKKPTDEDYSTVFYWNIGFSIFLYLLLYFSSPLIAGFYNMPILEEVLKVEGIILIINAGTIVQMNQLRKSMMFKKIALINVVSSIVSVIVAIVYAYYGGGIWSLVVQQLLQSALILILLWVTCKWRPLPSFSIESFKNLFSFGGFILISNLFITFTNNFKGLLIGKTFSASTLGYFSQAQKVENVSSTSLAAVVEQVTYPLLVEVKDNPDRMQKVLKQFNNALLALVMPIMFLMCLLAYPIIEFLFTDKWIDSAPILQVLSIQGIFICIQGTSYNAIAALGKSKVLFKWSVIKSATGLILLVTGLILAGFNGILWGMVVGSCMIVLYNFYLVSRYTNYTLSSQIIDLIPVTLAATIPFLCVFSASILFSLSIIENIILGFMYLIGFATIILIVPIKSFGELKSNIISLLIHK